MNKLRDHQPVLVREVIEFLNVNKGGRYVDATLGAGGHTVGILERGGRLLAIDWDRQAIELVRSKFKAGRELILVNDNFENIENIVRANKFYPVDGVVFDLGISSMQLDRWQRGFSFSGDQLLDMRMDPDRQGVTAADLLNALDKQQLYELFSKTSQKNVARAVAAAIVRARLVKRIERTQDLVDIVGDVRGGRPKNIHPATTVFLALRLAVNSELDNLPRGLAGALAVLRSGGRLAVISFHSGEDRIVKAFFRDQEKLGTVEILTSQPVVPSEEERGQNPRSRSAKLRVVEKK